MAQATDRPPLPVARAALPEALRPADTARSRDRMLLVYIALGMLILLPGIVAAFGLWQEDASPVGAFLAALDKEMQQIEFGRTTRFWLGVAGTTMMGLLLLYPLRKLFGFGSWMSVGGWFHFHVVLGLLGPIFILYHCYFGSGSTPANVALVTTLVVAVSGFFGHYVYSRLSADFHGERKRSLELLEAAIADLGQLALTPSRSKLVDDLKAYEEQALARGHGVLGRLALTRRLRATRRDLLARAVWLVDNQGPEQGWSLARCRETKSRLFACITGYFSGLSRAARGSVYERAARVWRLMHMPLFFITVAATAIHVWKVWDMDGPKAPAGPAVLEQRAGGAEPGGGPDGKGGASAAGVAGSAATAGGRAAGHVEPRKSAKGASPAERLLAQRKVTTQPVPGLAQSAPTASAPPTSSPAARAISSEDPIARVLKDDPTLVQGPKLAQRSAGSRLAAVPAGEPRAASEPPAAANGAATDATMAASGEGLSRQKLASLPEPMRLKAPQTEPTPPSTVIPPPVTVRPAQLVAKAPAGPASAAAPAPAPEPDPVDQLEKKTAQWDKGGRLDPATLRARLAELKADSTFSHDKTRFPLTGKHKRVACEACHKATLKGTPMRCIDCHAKDDVHRGRRPNCEECHVTSGWGTVKRKK